jgi:ubiquinone/menaquinone biosynthesis C-methylase UbiE
VAGWKEKRRIMQRYDLTAEMYEERYAAEQKAKYRAALENVNVANNAVLDVGCGTGLFFSSISPQANIVVGVDISHKLLLKAKVQTATFSNVFILKADADHLPFRDTFFDDVFAFTVLQNMPKPSKTLIELKRVAKLGGRVAVTGLKKAFSLNEFMDDIDSTGFKMISFIDNEDLKCYVAVLAA